MSPSTQVRRRCYWRITDLVHKAAKLLDVAADSIGLSQCSARQSARLLADRLVTLMSPVGISERAGTLRIFARIELFTCCIRSW